MIYFDGEAVIKKSKNGKLLIDFIPDRFAIENQEIALPFVGQTVKVNYSINKNKITIHQIIPKVLLWVADYEVTSFLGTDGKASWKIFVGDEYSLSLEDARTIVRFIDGLSKT